MGSASALCFMICHLLSVARVPCEHELVLPPAQRRLHPRTNGLGSIRNMLVPPVPVREPVITIPPSSDSVSQTRSRRVSVTNRTDQLVCTVNDLSRIQQLQPQRTTNQVQIQCSFSGRLRASTGMGEDPAAARACTTSITSSRTIAYVVSRLLCSTRWLLKDSFSCSSKRNRPSHHHQ